MESTTAMRRSGGEKGGGAAPVFRPDYMFWREQRGEYMERRQLFLRSYHFSRKQAPRERVRGTLLRVRSLVWARLRDARRLPCLLWSKLRGALARCRAALPGGSSSRMRRRTTTTRRREQPHRLAAGGCQFQRLPHRRTASNSSSGSSAGAEWHGW